MSRFVCGQHKSRESLVKLSAAHTPNSMQSISTCNRLAPVQNTAEIKIQGQRKGDLPPNESYQGYCVLHDVQVVLLNSVWFVVVRLLLVAIQVSGQRLNNPFLGERLTNSTHLPNNSSFCKQRSSWDAWGIHTQNVSQRLQTTFSDNHLYRLCFAVDNDDQRPKAFLGLRHAGTTSYSYLACIQELLVIIQHHASSKYVAA